MIGSRPTRDQYLNIACLALVYEAEADCMEGAGIFCGDLLIVDKGRRQGRAGHHRRG